MKEWIGRFALTVLLATGSVHAQDALSIQALAQCATQVQHLREESARLNRHNGELDVQRKDINQRSAALQAERASLAPDDVEKGLNYRQRLQAHNANTLAFNARIEQIRLDIDAINVRKLEYDRECAKRPYHRADLDTLPTAQREAMRAGLSGVEIPYIEPAAPP